MENNNKKKDEVLKLNEEISNVLNRLHPQASEEEKQELDSLQQQAKNVYQSDLNKADKKAAIKEVLRGLTQIGTGIYGYNKGLNLDVDLKPVSSKEAKSSAAEKYAMELANIREKQRARKEVREKEAGKAATELGLLSSQLKEVKDRRAYDKRIQAQEALAQQEQKNREELENLKYQNRAALENIKLSNKEKMNVKSSDEDTAKKKLITSIGGIINKLNSSYAQAKKDLGKLKASGDIDGFVERMAGFISTNSGLSYKQAKESLESKKKLFSSSDSEMEDMFQELEKTMKFQKEILTSAPDKLDDPLVKGVLKQHGVIYGK